MTATIFVSETDTMGDPKVDYSKICRVCMKSRKLTPIFGDTAGASNASRIDYSIIIRRHAAVEIWKNDGLPQNICYGCIALLNSITHFTNMCEESYSKFQHRYRPQYRYSGHDNSGIVPMECVESELLHSKRKTAQPMIYQSNMKTTSNQVELKNDTRKMFVEAGNNETKYNIEYDNYSYDGNENDTSLHKSNVSAKTLLIKTPKFSPSTVKNLIQSFEVKMKKDIKHREKYIQNRMSVKELMRMREEKRQNKMLDNRHRKEFTKHDIEKRKVLKDMIVQVNATKAKEGQWSQEKAEKFASLFRLIQENALVQGPAGEKVTNLLQCIKCNSIMQEVSAKRHYKFHQAHKYICEHCGHGFHIRSEMERHCMAKHGKKKTYGCNLCTYETPYKPEFTVHMRVHTGERPFACDICGRTFYKKQVLTKHVALHSNLRPHQCLYCQKGFATSFDMKSHINSVHHRRYVYKCTECDVTYARISTVRKHLVAIHRVPRDRQKKIPKIDLD